MYLPRGIRLVGRAKHKSMQRTTFFLGLFLSFASKLFGQAPVFHTLQSDFFDDPREIEVVLPNNWNYASERVEWPVIYILDGQHEFAAGAVKNDIQMLQMVKEMPDAIVVIIHHEDRVEDCALPKDNSILPLHSFMVEELDPFIHKTYRSSTLRVLIGHSFTASFGLRSAYWSPDFYDALLLHSPLNQIEKSTSLLLELNEFDFSKIYLSVGGSAGSKDKWHLAAHRENQEKHPDFYNQIHFAQVESASHNALPAIKTASFLTEFFFDFSVRTDHIAQVDMNYQLVQSPGSVEEEMKKVERACTFGEDSLNMSISEINGMASRYWAGEHTQHVEALYEYGIDLYDDYYDFYIYLAQLKGERGLKTEALELLKEARRLCNLHESGSEAHEYIISEIILLEKTFAQP